MNECKNLTKKKIFAKTIKTHNLVVTNKLIFPAKSHASYNGPTANGANMYLIMNSDASQTIAVSSMNTPSHNQKTFVSSLTVGAPSWKVSGFVSGDMDFVTNIPAGLYKVSFSATVTTAGDGSADKTIFVTLAVGTHLQSGIGLPLNDPKYAGPTRAFVTASASLINSGDLIDNDAVNIATSGIIKVSSISQKIGLVLTTSGLPTGNVVAVGSVQFCLEQLH